jgi:pimeloyl-ACP methyl ester carboxylesterase
MDGTGKLFSEFSACLPSGTEPVVISYPPEQPMGYAELEAFTRAKLPSRPFVLLGESFSGPLAVALAAADPAMVRALVLVGSFVRAPIRAPRWLQPVLAALPVRWIPPGLVAAFAFGRWSSRRLRSLLSESMSAVPPATWRARLRAVLSVDAGEKLRSVRVPVLYLRGAADRMVPRSAGLLIRELLPSARLVELDGPHFLLQAKPVESAAQVAAFIREAGLAQSMRFDIYGRYEIEVAWDRGTWKVFSVGEGKRAPLDHVLIPPHVKEKELSAYLDDLFHELAKPGRTIRRVA